MVFLTILLIRRKISDHQQLMESFELVSSLGDEPVASWTKAALEAMTELSDLLLLSSFVKTKSKVSLGDHATLISPHSRSIFKSSLLPPGFVFLAPTIQLPAGEGLRSCQLSSIIGAKKSSN